MCNDIMTFGKKLVVSRAQLSGVSTSAIASGDWISDAISEFTGFEKEAHIEVLGVRLWEAATAQKKDVRLWLFTATVAGVNSNDAATMTAGEALTLIGTVDIEDTDYINTASDKSFAQKMLSTALAAKLGAGGIIYGFLTAREAVTYTTATPITVEIICRQHE